MEGEGLMQKVAAYCRVSTDSSDQVNSLASQEKYFRDYIQRNPEWELAKVFVDTGISGTSTKKRVAFNQMIEEAMLGKFHLILTKEISRFARNTLDSIYYTRKLKERGIGVVFMNDNINTLDPDAELRLTIMSSIAQEESRKTSQRVKWGQKRRMEQGVVFGRDMLGYDVRNGKIFVNEEGAEIVRLIFHKYVNEKKGTYVIARELQELGIPTSTYMKHWSNTGILRIIRNEKYVGDLIQKKTYTPNYLNHEKKYNDGQEEQIILYNHHEPIIDRDFFNRAQLEMKKRSLCKEQAAKHSNRYCFSGKIKCDICGSSFVARTKKRKDGSLNRLWRCYHATTHGARHINNNFDEIGCNCPSVKEADLKSIIKEIFSGIFQDKAFVIKTVENILGKLSETKKNSTNNEIINLREDPGLASLLHKKQELIELYMEKEITKEEFRKLKEKFEIEISDLKQEKEFQLHNSDLIQNQVILEEQVERFIKELLGGESWNDSFYKNILDTIIVSQDNTLTISFYQISKQWTVKMIDHSK